MKRTEMTKTEMMEFYELTLVYFKESDNGRHGKAFEINVKEYLNGKRGNSNKVSAIGKTDVKHKGITYEIKSNCGEINDNIYKNDFIIYTEDNRANYCQPWNAYVIPVDEFIDGLKALNLLRRKRATNGAWKTTIQTYSNSKKRLNAFKEWLSTYPTIDECLK